MTVVPHILRPYDKREAASLAEAANIAGRSPETVRQWAAVHDLGRMVGGRWAVSRVALAAYLDGDRAALKAYLAGDRTSDLVAPYFRKLDL